MENRYDLSGSLLHWYDYNKRLLPWRENKDPYRIWISEIMLQQTRVEAVKPYFDRFMEALPTVYDLAEVEDDRLMKLWEGLGYYNRARNLKAAAQTIVQEYGGQLPADYDKLLSLKGIGMYTAGAIGSLIKICFLLQDLQICSPLSNNSFAHNGQIGGNRNDNIRYPLFIELYYFI